MQNVRLCGVLRYSDNNLFLNHYFILLLAVRMPATSEVGFPVVRRLTRLLRLH